MSGEAGGHAAKLAGRERTTASGNGLDGAGNETRSSCFRAEDVLTAALAKLHEQEARTAAEKVARLMQQYRARRLAVVGLQE